ncbi:MAG: membrane protein insertase YidC [Bacteroidales bacterium]|nr:membrane protein insertase YidC [Bacteroidales bacterium]
MDKNSIIGFVLIAVIFIGFTIFQSNQSRKRLELQAQLDSISRAENLERQLAEAERTVALTDSLPEAQAAPASIYKDTLLEAASHAQEEIITLENSKLKIQFTTRGAQPYAVQVKDYKNYDSTDLYLFKPGGAEYSLSLYAGEAIRTRDFNFQVAERTDSTLVMRLPFAGGGYIEQKYTLRSDSYQVDNLLSFVEMGNVIPRNVTMFDLDFDVTMPRMEKGYKNEAQYSKLDYYFTGDKKPSEIGRGKNGSRRIDSKLSWFAFQQQFFSAIMRAPGEFASGELALSFYPQDDPDHNLMACSAQMRADLPQGGNGSIPFEFYFGPNHFKSLKAIGNKYEKIIPLGGWLVGWFTRYAIIPMFDFFHRFISSFGLIILLMTIVIKIVVFPLTYKSYASSAKMSALKPELDKLNEKFPHNDNQQEMMKKQQATMELYKRAGVSPMGGCLPTLLTFPILWAMFRFFPASIELRQQPFLWCDDLSGYDSIVDFGARVPLIGDHLSLFALLMAVTMWLYSKMTMSSQPGGNDPNAASMRFMTLWMMPIMMFFICNNLSAALSYYYLLSQLIAMVQTWAIRKSIDKDAILAKVRASMGKPLPKSKWQQRLEEAQKLQEQKMREQQKKQRR